MAVQRIIILSDKGEEQVNLHSALDFDGLEEAPAGAPRQVDVAVQSKFDQGFLERFFDRWVFGKGDDIRKGEK